eukprot:8906266-Alexandrium_andersonii.AAC.1
MLLTPTAGPSAKAEGCTQGAPTAHRETGSALPQEAKDQPTASALTERALAYTLVRATLLTRLAQ